VAISAKCAIVSQPQTITWASPLASFVIGEPLATTLSGVYMPFSGCSELEGRTSVGGPEGSQRRFGPHPPPEMTPPDNRRLASNLPPLCDRRTLPTLARPAVATGPRASDGPSAIRGGRRRALDVFAIAVLGLAMAGGIGVMVRTRRISSPPPVPPTWFGGAGGGDPWGSMRGPS